jgi:DNA-directed RNA polymerase specialized sigma subunit
MQVEVDRNEIAKILKIPAKARSQHHQEALKKLKYIMR